MTLAPNGSTSINNTIRSCKWVFRVWVSEGAQATVGGHALDHEGYFVEPTVLVDTKPEMKVVKEEIFGPVVTAMPF